MDRFIDSALKSKIEAIEPLKSNMDRFIAVNLLLFRHLQQALKSNMDRFIAYTYRCTEFDLANFKIQYGQIYRKNG